MQLVRSIMKLIRSGAPVLAMVLTLSSQVWATKDGGASDGGGGDAIICGRLHPQVYLADYFLLRNPILSREFIRDLFADSQMSEAGAVNHLESLMFDYLKTSSSADLVLEAERLERISLRYVFVPSLPELDDDGIQIPPEFLQSCYKRQVAIQNINTSEVQVVQEVYSYFSAFDRALLRFHERYINLEKKPGELTSGLRKKTMRLFLSPEFNDYLINKISGGQPDRIRRFRVRAALYRKAGKSPMQAADVMEFRALNAEFRELGFPSFNPDMAAARFAASACRRQLPARFPVPELNLVQPGEFRSHPLIFGWYDCMAQAIN